MRSEGINIVDAVNAKAVPIKLTQAILDIDGVCECGEPLEFDSKMREIRCSSESCLYARKAEAERALRFLGATEEEVYNIQNEILKELKDNKNPGCVVLISENENIRSIIDKYVEDEMMLSEILGLTGIILLAQSSESIMLGYRSVSELYDDLDKNDLVTLIRKLQLEKGILIANEIKENIDKCRVVLIEIERKLNVRVKASKAKKIAGKNTSEGKFIGVATDESADIIGSYTNNKLFGTVVEAVNEKRVRKGLSALQKL